MKKLLALLLVLCMLFVLVSCEISLGDSDGTSDKGDNNDNKDDGNNNGDGGKDDGNNGEKTHTYTDFTPSDKSLINEKIGRLIPFLSNDEYYLEEYSSYIGEGYTQIGVNFYTVGTTEEEYEAYRALFADFTLEGESESGAGGIMYRYVKGNLHVDMVRFLDATTGLYYVDIFAYVIEGSGDGTGNGNGSEDKGDYTYTDFTDDEKKLLNERFGFVIPFLPNNEYVLEVYTYESAEATEEGYNFYAFEVTSEEFAKYLALFDSFTSDGTEEDDNGDAWYYFSSGDVMIDLAYYYYDDAECYILDLYIYVYTSITSPDDSGNSGSGDSGNTGPFTDFTAEEKQLMTDRLGQLIPFLTNNEYYLEEYDYSEDGYSECGVNFYTFGNTQAEFEEYLKNFDSYTLDGTEEDEYGDTWYYYSKGDLAIDVTFYYYNGNYVLDMYAYIVTEGESGSGDSGNTGTGGSGNSGNAGTGVDLITNAGAGLPEGEDGVFNVDFTKAENVKDVTDQGYYLDGCPTTGSPSVLVIPVEFKDITALSKGYTTETLSNAFVQNGLTDYYSVFDYYYLSSIYKLELDVTVLDFWFMPKENSTYYYNATYDYYGDVVSIGDQLILDEALAYLAELMDLSKFDSDNNGTIDSVILVNTLDVGNDDFHWAYRYWNIYTDDDGYFYEYDGVSANDYIWVAYQFLHESTDALGNTSYDTSVMNTYTFIHEFGHILGADDYYDTEYVNEPMGGCDIMDSMLGDHNAYTKFNLGWITSSRLVVTDTTVTLTLSDFQSTGDTIIIANNWDEKLGVYQEYYVIAYYKGEGLNGGDAGYFYNDGIVVYHVNASLYREEIDGEVYYDVYNSNTSSSSDYGTEDNLIEYVKSSEDTYVYLAGYTMPEVTDDQGNKLSYTFTVDSITSDTATLTFTAK